MAAVLTVLVMGSSLPHMLGLHSLPFLPFWFTSPWTQLILTTPVLFWRGRDFFTPPWDDGFGDPEFMARHRDETRVKVHALLLEQVVLVDPLEQWLPWCLDGRRAVPPEDVGGTGGYAESWMSGDD